MTCFFRNQNWSWKTVSWENSAETLQKLQCSFKALNWSPSQHYSKFIFQCMNGVFSERFLAFKQNMFCLQFQSLLKIWCLALLGSANRNLLEPSLTGDWEDILGRNYCMLTLFLWCSLSYLLLATVNNGLVGYMDLLVQLFLLLQHWVELVHIVMNFQGFNLP